MHPAITEWLDRKAVAELGGGQERIDKQHLSGKLTVRERLNYLLDNNSFQEIGMFVTSRCPELKREIPADGIVMGYGRINGRPVYVFGHDFTAFGGSTGEMSNKKIVEITRMAVESGVPMIVLNDSGGGRLEEAPYTQNFNWLFNYNVMGSGWIPQISAIMGPCAGGAAYSPALTDFIFMVDKTSNMFVTGPKVIQQVTGEDVDKEKLGGARAHTSTSGVAHFITRDDYDCLDQIKYLMSFLPQNASEKPPVYACTDDPNRLCPELDDIIPENLKRAFNVKDIIKAIVDDGNYMEIMANWAQNVVVALGRMNGRTVGFFGNQPKCMGGCMDINGSDKAARFVRFCDAFNIPIVYLADVPGFLPGVSQEHGGVLRHGAKLLYANCEATVPKIVITLRKFYGGGNGAMCGDGMGADLIFFWPTGQGALVGAEGAVNVLYRKELAAASEEERPALYRQYVNQYNEKHGKPYSLMRGFLADEIIRPSETRRVICQALELLANKKVTSPVKKKHGNIPL